MMPTFLVIGAAKSGTTALWAMLRQHPDVGMAMRKEPNFFSADDVARFANGPRDGPYVHLDLDGYRALFRRAGDARAVGEASVSTLYFPAAAEKLKSHVPDARIIAVLRQPAERAFSAFMHLRRDGREPLVDFAAALAQEERRIAQDWGMTWHYTAVGRYREQLSRFYERFPSDRIRIFLHDDLVNDPLRVTGEIFAFIGVDPGFEPKLDTTINRSGLPRYPLLRTLTSSLIDYPNPARYVARRVIPEDLRTHAVQKIRGHNVVPQTIPADIRRTLTEGFRPDIERLQDLIDRDLSHWVA